MSSKAMEAEIFKLILANKGAFETNDLIYNLYPGDVATVSEIINNRDKFAMCCPGGQPKVVVRSRLKLCRLRDCGGTCGGLHLCKNFLFSGSCHFTQLRRGCNFSHELNSDHNQRILREHELDSLSREELCTLLLQSDHTLLPSICHDYNNGDPVFGRCQEGDSCKRLHICERFVTGQDCSCPKTHDFNAAQPKKNLAGVPDTLIRSLKSVYANKVALRFSDRGWSSQPKQWHRGRGRGGYRGSRGNRGNIGRGGGGNLGNHSRASSLSDILDNIDDLDLYGAGSWEDGSQQLDSDASDASAATANDDETSSISGQSRKQTRYRKKPSAGGRGRGRGRGNHQPPHTTRSTSEPLGADGFNRRQDERRHVRDKTEICMYFIKGYCKHEERCFKAHDKMPYRWEVQEGDRWTHLANNEAIEKDYCDPQNAYSSGSPVVHFDTMTCGPNKVRRLSTVNSLVEPTFIHTTEWVWYWEDEFGKWNMYASEAGGHRAADIDSAKLEQMFLQNDKDVVEFTAGSQSYTLCFQDMIQTNKRYGTKRVVSRRPRFVSAVDVQERKVRRPLVQNSTPVPVYWDKTQIPTSGYKPIPLQKTSDEFKEVAALFSKTMIGFDIITIKRIQNKALWEVFQWQKNHMKTNNGGHDVTEKKLFHGTDNKHIEAICHHNFDWRICGTHGTAYGKGSYFARDAKYSHSYTSNTNVKSLFISRVLVGTYTSGKSDYTRPPSKDGGDLNFFDSCVDDVLNPSIFVVFEKHQIYPEYLLQYQESNPYTDMYGITPSPRRATAIATPAPRPVVAPKPVVTPRPAPNPTPVYRSSTSLYQTSTPYSSYQSSSTLNQPTRYSPPSPPHTVPKKQSDSCVIA